MLQTDNNLDLNNTSNGLKLRTDYLINKLRFLLICLMQVQGVPALKGGFSLVRDKIQPKTQ